MTDIHARHVLFHMLGDANTASSRVRGYWIADELRALGYETSFFSARTRSDYLRLAWRAFRSDVVIFQKRYSRYDVLIARILNALGRPIFFDIDDAPSRNRSPVTERNAARMMRLATRVFAGSHNLKALVDKAGGHSEFLPSGIRLENYAVSKQDDRTPICLGWIGNGGHYADDLVEILREPLRMIAARQPIRFKIVGACGETRLSDGFGGIEGLELDMIDQLDWSNPADVAAAVVDFDIGLYPLRENPFNKFKCAFKALEYMATGIPVVASNVGANGDVVTDKSDGFLVNGPDQWVNALQRLIESPEERHAMGQAGRLKIEQDYSTAALARQVAGLL